MTEPTEQAAGGERRQPTVAETLKDILEFLAGSGEPDLAHRFGTVTQQISERLNQANAKSVQAAEDLAAARHEIEMLGTHMNDQQRRHESALATLIVEERSKLAKELSELLDAERLRVERELVQSFEVEKTEAVSTATMTARAEIAALNAENESLRASIAGERAVRDLAIVSAVADERAKLEGENMALRRARDTTELVLKHMFMSVEESAKSAAAESERLSSVVARHKSMVSERLPWTVESIAQIRDSFAVFEAATLGAQPSPQQTLNEPEPDTVSKPEPDVAPVIESGTQEGKAPEIGLDAIGEGQPKPLMIVRKKPPEEKPRRRLLGFFRELRAD